MFLKHLPLFFFLTIPKESTHMPILAETGNLIELSPVVKQYLWWGLGIYIAGMLIIGYISSRKVSTMGDFLVAGRRLPLWMATATLLATWFGAGSSMGVAATVFSGDLRDVIADPFAASISLILAGIFIVGLLRKHKCMTVTDIIERQYGRTAGIYASFWMLPVYIGWLGAQVLGIGTILNLLTGMPTLYGTLAGAFIVFIYTACGGMWAVTLTDVVQVTLIILGLALILPGAVSLAGGWEAVYSTERADLSLLPAETTWNSSVEYVGSWIIMGLGCMVGQDLVQRSLASKNPSVAKQSSIYSGILYMFIGMIPITIGLAAKILFPDVWHIDMAGMESSQLENSVLPYVAIRVLGDMHPLILTIFISALVAAIMSSADSSLLAASSLFSNNILRPMYPKLKDKDLLVITRGVTLIVLAVATILALAVQSIYSLMINCWASQLVVVFVPVVTALYFPRSTKSTALMTMGVSTAVWIIYMAIGAIGLEGGFTEIMESDTFGSILTIGAVYGFVSGIITFAICYCFDLKKSVVNRDIIPETTEIESDIAIQE